jgi:DNA polymerase-3 subunit delta
VPGRAIGEADILEAVTNSARFDVFRLTDAVLGDDVARALRVLAALRAEGVEPTLISWALSREISLLTRLTFAAAHGENLDNALARLGVWRRRQAPVKHALRRYGERRIARLLAQAAEVDGIIKGIVPGRPWEALTALVMAMFPRRPAASHR